MSGAFALARETFFAWAAGAGQTVSGNQTLAVLGHLAIVAFIISASLAWWWEHARVLQLEAQIGQPTSLTTEHIERLSDAQREIATLKTQLSAAQPRTLTEAQRQQFRNSLAAYDARDQVICFERYAEVPDGELLGHVVSGLFRGLSWHVAGGVGFTDDANYKHGIWVYGGQPSDRTAVGSHVNPLTVSHALSRRADGRFSDCVVLGVAARAGIVGVGE